MHIIISEPNKDSYDGSVCIEEYETGELLYTAIDGKGRVLGKIYRGCSLEGDVSLSVVKINEH